jgi:hypothetical protein
MRKIIGRDAEEPCRLTFNKWLEKVACNQDIAWEKGEPNHPPDYFLTVGSKRYAVEVTSLVDAFGSTDRRRTSPAILEDRRQFKDFVREGLEKIGPLDRYWDVGLYNMPHRKEWGQMRDRIFDAIMGCRTGSGSEDVHFEGGVIWSHAGPKSGLDVGPFLSSFVECEAREILKRALQKKVDSLNRRDVAKPWLLLCWSGGILVEKEDYLSVLTNELIGAGGEFEAVFVVDGEGADLRCGRERFWETELA